MQIFILRHNFNMEYHGVLLITVSPVILTSDNSQVKGQSAVGGLRSWCFK